MRNLGTARCCFRNAPAHLTGGGRLFLNRSGNGRLDIVDLVNNGTNLRDRLNRCLGIGLDGPNLLTDILCCLSRFFRQFLDLVCDHRKAFAGFTGAGGFNRGVQCEQGGLLGYRGDHLDVIANLRTAFT